MINRLRGHWGSVGHAVVVGLLAAVWSLPRSRTFLSVGNTRHHDLKFLVRSVKLLSGSLSKQNPGNQFGHVAPIFTIVLLAITAVVQIICLNRGLKVYDSTLVVPVFYGVYTATGFLDSLVRHLLVNSRIPPHVSTDF